MKIWELGEEGLIRLVKESVGKTGPEGLVLGIGDDAAVWRSTLGWEVATTDSLVQDVHFTLARTSWRDLGWKALAVNLSDIAAMGATPRYVLISLSLPGETEVSSVAEFYNGMLELAEQHGVTVAGGNFSAAPLVVITVMALGSLEPEESLSGGALRRSAAIAGDLIGVTGYLGLSAGGLRLLSEDAPRLGGEALIRAHLRPSPRVNEGQLLRRKGVKAAIDISDGLLLDLERLCEASEVGARLRIDQIPIHPQLQAHCDEPLTLALSGGEDYEILFTAPPPLMEEIKRESLTVPVAVIGEVAMGAGVTLLDAEGREIHMKGKGWEHFKGQGQRP